MINRRYLRIKVFQALYAFFKDEQADLVLSQKNLINSVYKTYELFLFNLSFVFEWRHFVSTELDIQQNKFFPSQQLINSLKAIQQNKIIQAFTESDLLKEKIKKVTSRWTNTGEQIREIYNDFKNNSLFTEYGQNATTTFKEDKQFLIGFYELLFADSDIYNSIMDEHFINWEDDMVLVLAAIEKTIGSVKPDKTFVLPELFKDEAEDVQFIKDLFELTIQHNQELSDLIISKTENWDEDRIIFVDNLLMKMALCEILYFPYIPVKVSINEYLELAKLYSTSNSHSFINGVLDKIQIELKKQNKILKLGRGLVE